MSGLEALTVVAAVAALVSAYKDGGEVVKKLKLRRARRNGVVPNPALEDALESGRESIEKQQARAIARFGHEWSDREAVDTLKDVRLRFYSSVLKDLARALDDDEFNDFSTIINSADIQKFEALTAVGQAWLRKVEQTAGGMSQEQLYSTPSHEQLPSSNSHTNLRSLHIPQNDANASTLSLQPSPSFSLSQWNLGSPQQTSHFPQRQSAPPRPSRRATSMSATTASSMYSEPVRRQTGFSNGGPSRSSTGLTHGPSRSSTGLTGLGIDVEPSESVRPDVIDMQSPQPSNSSNGVSSLRRSSGALFRRRTEDAQSPTPPETPRLSRLPPRRSYAYGKRRISYGASSSSPPEQVLESFAESDHIEEEDSNEIVDEATRQWLEQSQRLRVDSPHSMRAGKSLAVREHDSDEGRNSFPEVLQFPSAANHFHGFCPGALRLQAGMVEDALKYAADVRILLSEAKFERCFKCAFSCQIDRDTVRVYGRGVLRFRWAFLAKCHVRITRALNENYTYNCIFCALQGRELPSYGGADSFLHHVASHADDAFGPVMLDRTKCINDRLADEGDSEWDINFVPEQDRPRLLAQLLEERERDKVDRDDSNISYFPPYMKSFFDKKRLSITIRRRSED